MPRMTCPQDSSNASQVGVLWVRQFCLNKNPSLHPSSHPRAQHQPPGGARCGGCRLHVTRAVVGLGIVRLVGRRPAKGAPDGGLRGPWGVCGQVFLDLGPSLKLRSTMGQAEVEVGSLRQAHPLGTLPSGLQPGAQASPHPGTPRGKCWAGLTGHETFIPKGLPTPPDVSRDNCGTGRLVDSLMPPGLQEGTSPGPLDPG